ncbi:MAG: hypothetical protein ABEJ81_03110 [Haloferacaceae archaeon]
MSGDDHRTVDRRTVLGALAGAGTTALSGCSALDHGTDATTTPVEEGRARELAAEFAPVLYFDEHERWFPTDPRPYATDGSDGPVVDGFDAFDGYAARVADGGAPPAPTVFYHVVEYEDSPLAVVQFWMYSAFDQFATNFHWHDWEVLQVFVDTDAGDPQLYVASAHARKVPNNEFLDPDPGTVPHVLTELGSHSSGLSVNADPDRFQRFPTTNVLADITNEAIEGIPDLSDFPVAYGLPRDEGGRLPYLVPELDGTPLYDHEGLPSVDRSDLVGEQLTVRSFADLASPPADLPERTTGRVFRPAIGRGATADADVTYDLVPTSDLERIADFTGPQLSYEFAVPDFAEDAVASHITTAGVPWEQPRYDDPATDVSDPHHRAALADRYDAVGGTSPVNAVFAAVTQALPSGDAPAGKGLTTDSLPVETVALLESEATAIPTVRGVAMVRGVPAGTHRLTVNGAGVAPHSETVSVADGDPTTAGVGGEIPLVARGDATKLEVDTRGTDDDLTDLAVEDDFAGRLYDAPLSGPDAVYVHRAGAYTTEVRDAADDVGAFRVTPTDEATIRIDEPRTGKASLATFLADVAEETRADVVAAVGDAGGTGTAAADTADVAVLRARAETGVTPDGTERTVTETPLTEPTTTDDGSTVTETPRTDVPTTDRATATESGAAGNEPAAGAGNAVHGLSRALAAIAGAARRAAERAEAGDRRGADRSLAAVADALDRVDERLTAAREGLPDSLARATDHRLEQSRRRLGQARESEKL